jgi:hypothetical protein
LERKREKEKKREREEEREHMAFNAWVRLRLRHFFTSSPLHFLLLFR